MSRLLLFAPIVLLSAWTVGAQAQSLGEEIILSRIGDPVEVEIEFRDWQNVELDVVEVVNATRQQYEAFGLVYQPLLDTLSFNVVGPNLAGEVKILVSSREPADEPFLELLLALRWPDGSALREYVLLFDPPLPDPRLSAVEPQQPAAPVTVAEEVAPPVVVAQVSVPVNDPAPAEPAPVEPLPPPVTPPAPAPVARSVPPEPVVRTVVPTPVQPAAVVEVVTEPPVQPRPREEAGRGDYRVQNGDTLWTIASQFQPAGIADNMYQFVLSLHDINPAAFIDGNITLLKADAQLQIPSARDLAAINPASAQRVFDQRWLDATRAAQVAAAPEQPQLPVISPVVEAPVVEPVAVAQDEPEPPPGTELPDLVAEAEPALLAPSTVVVLAPAVEANAAIEPEPVAPIVEDLPVSPQPAAEVPAIQVVPLQVAVTTTTTEAANPPVPSTTAPTTTPAGDEPAEANAALRQITDRATAIRDLLQTRQQRLVAVEQQILALKTQLQQAESRAGELVQDLPPSADVTRQAVLLGLAAAVLLIALAATVLTALRWNREWQTRALKVAARRRRH